jgi:hypothetical protein
MKIPPSAPRALVGATLAVALASCSSGPVTGIDSLVTSTNYDAAQHSALGQTTRFSAGETAYVIFTTHAPKPGAHAVITLLRDGAVEDTSLPITVAKGDHTYAQQINLGMVAGTVTIEASYNGAVQQTTQITVG